MALGVTPRKPVASTYISADSARDAFGLTWRTLANERLSRATSSLLAPPCSTLHRKAPSRREDGLGEIERHLDQAHDAYVVGLLVPGRRRMHVGQHDIRRLAAQGLFDAVGGLWIGHIEMELGDTRDRLHLDDIDGDHPALPRHQLHALRGDLAPAAWRGAQDRPRSCRA